MAAAHPSTQICLWIEGEGRRAAELHADGVEPIRPKLQRLIESRSRLLALPAVARIVEEARLRWACFPLGAPDRD